MTRQLIGGPSRYDEDIESGEGDEDGSGSVMTDPIDSPTNFDREQMARVRMRERRELKMQMNEKP